MMLRLSLLFVMALAACGSGKTGKLVVDTPVLPYQAPDADELAGIEPAEEADEADGPNPAPTPPPKP